MKWDRRSKLLKISTYAIIICLILSVVIAGFTIYGNKVGNFVVSVDRNSSVSLALSEREDRSAETARLAGKGNPDMTLATLSDIPKNLFEGMGIKNDPSNHYLAYSFYLINHSERTIDYRIDIRIVEAALGVENVARIMLLENDSPRGTIYAAPRADGTPEDHSDVGQMEVGTEAYVTTPFVSANLAASVVCKDFEAGSYIKYTFVLWLEGEDEQATNAIQKGKIRVTMDFTGY